MRTERPSVRTTVGTGLIALLVYNLLMVVCVCASRVDHCVAVWRILHADSLIETRAFRSRFGRVITFRHLRSPSDVGSTELSAQLAQVWSDHAALTAQEIPPALDRSAKALLRSASVTVDARYDTWLIEYGWPWRCLSARITVMQDATDTSNAEVVWGLRLGASRKASGEDKLGIGVLPLRPLLGRWLAGIVACWILIFIGYWSICSAVRWSRRRRGACIHCGYPQTGLVLPCCPECGAMSTCAVAVTSQFRRWRPNRGLQRASDDLVLRL